MQSLRAAAERKRRPRATEFRSCAWPSDAKARLGLAGLAAPFPRRADMSQSRFVGLRERQVASTWRPHRQLRRASKKLRPIAGPWPDQCPGFRATPVSDAIRAEQVQCELVTLAPSSGRAERPGLVGPRNVGSGKSDFLCRALAQKAAMRRGLGDPPATRSPILAYVRTRCSVPDRAPWPRSLLSGSDSATGARGPDEGERRPVRRARGRALTRSWTSASNDRGMARRMLAAQARSTASIGSSCEPTNAVIRSAHGELCARERRPVRRHGRSAWRCARRRIEVVARPRPTTRTWTNPVAPSRSHAPSHAATARGPRRRAAAAAATVPIAAPPGSRASAPSRLRRNARGDGRVDLLLAAM